jgi:hypothetical protein
MAITGGNTMLKIALTALAVILSSTILTYSVSANESVVEKPATVIIYRADELMKSQWLSMVIKLDGAPIQRLHADDAVVATVPAGRRTLRGSILGTESLSLDLKPGSIHYVYSDVDIHGNEVRVKFSEVEEQVARVHRAPEEEAI